MRLTIPVTPKTTQNLAHALTTLSAQHPGPGHQLCILAPSSHLAVAEKFSTDARAKTKFASVLLIPVVMSQMTDPDNFLWVSHFRAAHPDTLWFDPGCMVVGGDGWLSRIEDSLRFATAAILTPETPHTTAVYRAGVHRVLRASECGCVKDVSPPVQHAHATMLHKLSKPSMLLQFADSVSLANPAVELLVPTVRGKFVLPTSKKVDEPTPEVTPEPTPEVDTESVKVDTEPKNEVSAGGPLRVVRRAKP